MNEITVIKRIAVLAAIIAGGIFMFAGGLMLLNVRADWALVAGGLVCFAAPTLGGVLIAKFLKEDGAR